VSGKWDSISHWVEHCLLGRGRIASINAGPEREDPALLTKCASASRHRAILMLTKVQLLPLSSKWRDRCPWLSIQGTGGKVHINCPGTLFNHSMNVIPALIAKPAAD
jgi:hypothetical protein